MKRLTDDDNADTTLSQREQALPADGSAPLPSSSDDHDRSVQDSGCVIVHLLNSHIPRHADGGDLSTPADTTEPDEHGGQTG